MQKQKCLSASMRAILVDWLVEVQENFELNHETLYLAVKLVDMYVSQREIAKEILQLVGAVALFIASKFDVSLQTGFYMCSCIVKFYLTSRGKEIKMYGFDVILSLFPNKVLNIQ